MSWKLFFTSQREFQEIVARVCACALVAGGCLFGLSAVDITGGWRLAYAFIALGLVCVAELNWRRKEPITRVAPEFTSPPWELSEVEKKEKWKDGQKRAEELFYEELREELRQQRIDRIKSLIELALLIGLALVTALLAHARTPPRGAGAHDSTLRGQQNEPALFACQNDLAKANAELQKCRAAIDQQAKDSNLAKSILDPQQQHPPSPPTPTSSGSADQHSISSLHISFGEILIAVIILIAVVMIARKHKEIVPVAGAAALATEALEHAAELAKMKEYMYDRVLWWFLVVSAALMVLFVIAALLDLKARAPVQTSERPAPGNSPVDKLPADKGWLAIATGIFGKPESKSPGKENYISSLGFSVVVLLWAAVMVGYKSQDGENPVKNEPAPSGTLSSVQLNPLLPFIGGKTELQDPNGLDKWKKYVTSQNLASGDMLLLVGSADCIPFRQAGDGHNNTALAMERAKAVQEKLKPEMDARGVRLKMYNLDQHEGCRKTDVLRAVYPFLIHDAQRQAIPR
jgi:hypothetical protein